MGVVSRRGEWIGSDCVGKRDKDFMLGSVLVGVN